MLKIRSFLRLTKDSIMNLIKKMFQRYNRHMAATAYALSAIVLVFYFGDFANSTVNTSHRIVDASTYEKGNVKSEETNASELFTSDNKEYALISPDNHIIQAQTETVDELPTDMIKHVSLKIYPLGQLSISPVTSEAYQSAVTMAILATQQDLLLPADARETTLELFALADNSMAVSVDSTESKVETIKDAQESGETLSKGSSSDGGIDNDTVTNEASSNETLNKETDKDSADIDDIAKQTESNNSGSESDQEKASVSDQAKASASDQSKDSESKKDQPKKEQSKVDPKEEPESTETLSVAEISVPSNLTLSINPDMKMTLSDDELEVLQRIVEAEATGEDIYGKILVANVVLNRVNAEEFPDTVSEVVFQKIGDSYQFSPTKDGRYWTVKISKSTKEAVKRALAGEDYSEGALYFFARKLTSEHKASWFDNTLRRVVQYGCHEFYAD